MLLDLEEENCRKGNFIRAYPNLETAPDYDQFFEVKRYQNALVRMF